MVPNERPGHEEPISVKYQSPITFVSKDIED